MEEGDSLRVQNIELPRGVDPAQLDGRLGLLDTLQTGFAGPRPDVTVQSHLAAYEKAVQMMRSRSIEAFDLEHEPAALRQQYGPHVFGQGCLLARRLVERGVPFVEVSLNRAGGRERFDWDTHSDNAVRVRRIPTRSW